jgi:Asp-tRNA(Asn)/Glu-tRNA(Gln) amidotransferase A subunit family amidase
VFPVTTVDPKLDVVDKSYKPVNSKDQQNWATCKLSQCSLGSGLNAKRRPKYGIDSSPEKYAGAPVSLQISGRRFHEAEVLGLVGVIAKAL